MDPAVSCCEAGAVPAQSATAEAFRNDYETLVAGFRGVPLPLPGSPYARARAAQRRLLRKIEGFVRRRDSRAWESGVVEVRGRRVCVRVRATRRRLLCTNEGFLCMPQPLRMGPPCGIMRALVWRAAAKGWD